VGVSGPVIELRAIRKLYALECESIVALDSVDLVIERNAYVAITGPSGSGKSTLMSVLGCLATPTAGRYLLEGADVACLSERELAQVRNRSIGFIFQSFNLLPRLNVLQNVVYPLKYRFLKPAVRSHMARQALERVGLSDRLKHLPNQLSGGQRQRVAIARALVTQPGVLLADEPTGNLDSRTTEEIMNLFEELHGQGQTIVMVTHDSEIADRCQREIHLVDGAIRSDVSRSDPSASGQGQRVIQ
jgi:putative ABC transport system ATP-binding protein